MVGKVTLSGVLLDPLNKPLPGVRIELKSVKTGDVISGIAAEFVTNQDGSYSVEIPVGSYKCAIIVKDRETSLPGYVNVYDYSGAGTLNEYLYAPCQEDGEPMFIVQWEMMRQWINERVSNVENEIRDKLIPLGKQYKDLSAAQSDLSNIPDGAFIYVHSDSDSDIAIEYKNVSGVLTKTGKSFLSKNGIVDLISLQTTEIDSNSKSSIKKINDLNNNYILEKLRMMNSEFTGYVIPIDYIRQYGSPVSYSENLDFDSFMKIDTITPTAGARRSVLSISDGIGDLNEIVILEGESISGFNKSSPFYDFNLIPKSINNINIHDSGFLSFEIPFSLKGTPTQDTTRIIYDRNGKFASYTPSTIYSGVGVTYSSAVSSLIFCINKTDVTDSGYELTQDGIKDYVNKEMSGYELSQKTDDNYSSYFCNLIKLSSGNVTVSSGGAAESDKNLIFISTIYSKKTGKYSYDDYKILSNSVSKNNSKNEDYKTLKKIREILSMSHEFSKNVGNITTVNNPVSYSSSIYGKSMLIIDKFSLATNSRICSLKVNDSSGEFYAVTLLEGERTEGEKIFSPYVDFYFFPKVFNNISVSNDTSFISMDVDCVLPGSIPADSSRIIRDENSYFAALTPVTIKSQRGVTYNSSTGRISLNISKSEVTDSGYDLDQKGIISYVIDKFSGYKFKQLTSVISERPFCNKFIIAGGNLSIETLGVAELDKNVSITARILTSNLNSNLKSAYKRYSCTAKNNTSHEYKERPVSIKCKFNPGEVFDDSCIIVKNKSGEILPSQWSPDYDYNSRRGGEIGFWPDGSLRCGAVIVIDSFLSGESKEYTIEAHTIKQSNNHYSRITKETQTSLLVTSDDGAEVRFDSVVGWMPYKAAYGQSSYSQICQHLLISRLSGGSDTFSCGYDDSKYTIISDGPLFTEIESRFKNLVQSSHPTIDSQYLEMKYRTKVFSSGYVQVTGITSTIKDIPENVLYGNEVRIQFNSTSNKSIRAGYNSIWTDNNSMKSISLNYANGDVRRDDGEVTTLASRPSVCNVTPTASYTRCDIGHANFSSTILGTPKGWAWSLGFSFNLNETISDNIVLSDIEANPVVSFASANSSYPYIRKSEIADNLSNIILGITSWSENEASDTDTQNGKFNTLAGSLVRHLSLGVSSFDNEYNKFSAWCDEMYGGITNIHMGSAAEFKGLQFASRLVLPHLHWLYVISEIKSDSVKMNNIKAAISNMASDTYNAFGAIGKANSNFYAASYRCWGLAVMAGVDSDGKYSAAMDMVDGQFSSKTYFEGVDNIITDNPGENVSGMRYLHYQMYAYNNYLLGCEAAKRTPVINMETYMLNAISSYGGLSEIDFCVAESRRGNPSTVAFMSYPLLHSGDKSCLEALNRMLDAFIEYSGSNTNGQVKLWDLNYYSTITTYFSEYTFACNIFSDAWLKYWFDNSK